MGINEILSFRDQKLVDALYTFFKDKEIDENELKEVYEKIKMNNKKYGAIKVYDFIMMLFLTIFSNTIFLFSTLVIVLVISFVFSLLQTYILQGYTSQFYAFLSDLGRPLLSSICQWFQISTDVLKTLLTNPETIVMIENTEMILEYTMIEVGLGWMIIFVMFLFTWFLITTFKKVKKEVKEISLKEAMDHLGICETDNFNYVKHQFLKKYRKVRFSQEKRMYEIRCYYELIKEMECVIVDATLTKKQKQLLTFHVVKEGILNFIVYAFLSLFQSFCVVMVYIGYVFPVISGIPQFASWANIMETMKGQLINWSYQHMNMSFLEKLQLPQNELEEMTFLVSLFLIIACLFMALHFVFGWVKKMMLLYQRKKNSYLQRECIKLQKSKDKCEINEI